VLNKVVMYSAINELNSIDSETKDNNKILLKNNIKELIDLFKAKKVIKKPSIKKEIITKKETITEKIKRINAKKKLLRESIK